MTAHVPTIPAAQPEADIAAFREFMRSWPTGVAVVTAAPAHQAVGCTVNAFASIALQPPLILVSLFRQSRTLAAICAQEAFGLNVLSWRQRHLAGHFATASGDRFADIPYWMQHGVPLIEGAMATAVCAVDRVIPAADHLLVLGDVRWYRQDDGRDPVVSFGGKYRALQGAARPGNRTR